MKKECTNLFLHYREVARLVWNLGLWPNPALREWDCVELYEEAMSRLFEAMILMALGFQGRIEDKYSPGKTEDFRVEIASPEAELLVNKNPQNDPGKIWGVPIMRLKPGQQQLRFIAFFDWYKLAPRDFQLLEVLIERMDAQPELVGRHGLVRLADCSISLIIDETSQDDPSALVAGQEGAY
jgi:hypothetical protein